MKKDPTDVDIQGEIALVFAEASASIAQTIVTELNNASQSDHIRSLFTPGSAGLEELTSRIARVVAGISIRIETSLPFELRHCASRGGVAVLRLKRETKRPLAAWRMTRPGIPALDFRTLVVESCEVQGGLDTKIAEILLMLILEDLVRGNCILPGFVTENVTRRLIRLRWVPPIQDGR